MKRSKEDNIKDFYEFLEFSSNEKCKKKLKGTRKPCDEHDKAFKIDLERRHPLPYKIKNGRFTSFMQSGTEARRFSRKIDIVNSVRSNTKRKINNIPIPEEHKKVTWKMLRSSGINDICNDLSKDMNEIISVVNEEPDIMKRIRAKSNPKRPINYSIKGLNVSNKKLGNCISFNKSPETLNLSNSW